MPQRLNALGYVASSPAGVIAGGETTALRAFQMTEGLQVDGVVGPETARALQQAEERAHLIRVLKEEGHVDALVLESHVTRKRPALYALFDGNRPLYRGDDPRMLREAVDGVRSSGTEELLVDLSRFPAEQRARLATTLRIDEAAHGNGAHRITLVTEPSGYLPFRRGSRLEQASAIEKTGEEYRFVLEIATPSPPVLSGQPGAVSGVGARTTTTAVVFVSAFFELLANLRDRVIALMYPVDKFAGFTAHGNALAPPSVVSLTEAVRTARGELARQHGLSAAELDDAIRVEFGGIQVVHHSLPATVPFAWAVPHAA